MKFSRVCSVILGVYRTNTFFLLIILFHVRLLRHFLRHYYPVMLVISCHTYNHDNLYPSR